MIKIAFAETPLDWITLNNLQVLLSIKYKRNIKNAIKIFLGIILLHSLFFVESCFKSLLNYVSLFTCLQANISQEEFFSKYNEYLSRVNYRRRRSAKFYGQDVTNFVYGDESESIKKIFTFKHSSELNWAPLIDTD